MLDVTRGDSADTPLSAAAELQCCNRRLVVYRAWLVLALMLLCAATLLFLLAMVRADQDSGRRVTWEWIPFLVMLVAYVPLLGVRAGAALDPSDEWREEAEVFARTSAVVLLCGIAACLDFVLLPRQRFGAKHHASANTSVGVLLLLQLFMQCFSVAFLWLYTVGHRRYMARRALDG